MLRRWAGLRGRFVHTTDDKLLKDKGNLDSSKREVTHRTQRILNKIVNRLVISSAGQKAWANIFKAVKETKLSTEDPISGKTVLPK